jgi:hypothetical protein
MFILDLPPDHLRAVLLVALVLAGCQEAKLDVPQTYPVSGKLADKSGKPIENAHIQLNLVSGADNQLIINGRSDKAGAFTLETQHMNDATKRKVQKGAPEGQYRVTIMPSNSYDQLKGPPPSVSWRPTTVKIEPKENILSFEVVAASRSAQ